MKIYWSFSHLFTWSLLLLVTACSTDFDVEAPWKDVPVVYGLLSRQDTAHYIRVEKAFLEPGGDATKIAQITDSLYYSEKVQVHLQRLSNNQIFTLKRVNGAQEGYPRKDGVFAKEPSILYKIRAAELQLKEGEKIRLLINRGEGQAPATAETTILGDIKPRELNPPSPINLGYDRVVNFAWDAAPAAKLFDLRLILHYRESVPGNTNEFVNKTLTWVLTDALTRSDNSMSNRVSYDTKGEEFYKFLQANLTPVSDRTRIFDSIDILITGVGEELLESLRLSQANTGITSAQTIPVYTNLSEGRGVFSSKATAARTGLTITQTAQDSLKNGRYTRGLNFQ